MKATKFKLDASPLDALQKQLGGLEAFFEKKNQIIAEICVEITPLARALVMESLKKSDIKPHEHNLEKEVARSVVIPTRKGLRIMMPPGLTKQDYARQGALQYGATRKSGLQDAKTRRLLKKAGKGGAIKAHPYYQLDDGGVRKLEAAFNERMQKKVNEAVAKG